MNTSIPCVSCQSPNLPGARFCTRCGTGLGGQPCANCGAPIKGGNFCTSCGTRAGPPEPTVSGSVAGGRWVRAPGEFVRRVGFEELRNQFDTDLKSDGGFWNMLVNFGQQALNKLQNLYVTIPTGSKAVVMFDGVVTEVLEPGRRALSGFTSALLDRLQATDDENGSLWQRIRNAFSAGATVAVEQLLSTRLERTSVYLFDTRPIQIPFHLVATGSSEDHALDLRVLVNASVAGTNTAERNQAFGLFLSRVVGDSQSLHAQALYQRILPHVERLARDASERFRDANGPNLPRIQEYVRERLTADVGTSDGLAFTVVAYTQATTLSMRLHLGQSQLPDLRACVFEDCSAELKFGQRYCVRCGKEQPTVVDPQRSCGKCEAHVPVGQKFCTACGTAYVEADARTTRLLTSDGEPIEIDLTFRAQCERERKDTSRLVAALVSTARAVLRNMTSAEACSKEGMTRIEKALAEGVKEAVLQLNLEFIGLNVLDVRGRNGEWLLNASAEVRRAESELMVGREWLRIDGDRLALQASTYELVRQRTRMQNDHELAAEEEGRRRVLIQTLTRLGHQYKLDVAALEDLENRQDIADREASMDVANARRGANVTMATDAAEREADRTLRDRGHEDTVTEFQQGAQVEDLQDGRRRTRERDEMGHQMDLENRSAEHDDARVRRGAKLESDLQRQGVDDAAYATQVGFDQAASEEQRRLDRLYVEDQRRQDLSLGRQRSEQEILLDRQRAEQALRLDSARAQQELEQSSAQGQHARDMEALKIAAQVQADRRRMEIEAEQAQARLAAEREAERTRLENERLAGRTGADLLAAQAAMLGNMEHGGAFAAALAAQSDGSTRVEMMQQMMDRDRTMSESSKAEMRQLFEQMVAMQQGQSSQNLARESMDKDRTNVMFQQMMQMMAANTAALAGANQASNERTVEAHRMAAQQAQSMSERSMDTMSNVAATASRGPQQVIMDPRIRPPQVEPTPRSAEIASATSFTTRSDVALSPATTASVGAACVHCAAPLDPGGQFCGACGRPQA